MDSLERAVRFRAYQVPLSALNVQRAMPVALMLSGYFQGVSYISKWAEELGLDIQGFIELASMTHTELLCKHSNNWQVFGRCEAMQAVPGDYQTLFYDYCSGLRDAASDFKSWSEKNGIDGTLIIEALRSFHRRETDSISIR